LTRFYSGFRRDAHPTRDGNIVLLSRFQEANSSSAASTVTPDSQDKLIQAERNPDAVAFSCVAAGEWWAE